MEIRITQNKLAKELKIKSIFLPKKTKILLKNALQNIGRDLKKKTLSLMDETPKHGRKYTRTIDGEKRTWTASAPEEAPATVTGKLRDSIKYYQSGGNRLDFGSYDVNYAPFLEHEDIINLEGQGSSKILPRPYISASYKKNETRIISRLKNVFKQLKKKET